MMTRTRNLDTHLKEIFTVGMDTPDGGKFAAKVSVQLGKKPVLQSLQHWREHRKSSGSPYHGDYVAPMIRDIGLCMAMGDTPADLMTAQMGKGADSVMNGGIEGAGGRDLHVGCFHRGVLPPTAPLPIASVTMTGMALSSWKRKEQRFHVACIGEGSSSSVGEWWEALNLAATRRLADILHSTK